MMRSSPATACVAPDRRGVGLMFEDFALFPHLTLLGNVLFGLKPLGRKAALAQARQALRRVGLGDREADYPHMLSGGQQQRLALARSIAPRPGILMLDEPFSSTHARMRESVRNETLAVLRETHATTIIVTHDPGRRCCWATGLRCSATAGSRRSTAPPKSTGRRLISAPRAFSRPWAKLLW